MRNAANAAACAAMRLPMPISAVLLIDSRSFPGVRRYGAGTGTLRPDQQEVSRSAALFLSHDLHAINPFRRHRPPQQAAEKRQAEIGIA